MRQKHCPMPHAFPSPSWLAALLCCAVALSPALPHPAHAAAREASPLVIAGIIAHDQGPASDHHEHGIDLNLEVQFRPLNIPGSPRPGVGTTLNFSGDTSIAYAGLNYPLYETRRWFGSGFIGAALHNGPLHKEPVRCKEKSDCGFGVRVLPRLSVEWGYYVSTTRAISLYWAHFSHRRLLASENEGVDHLGLRYRQPF